MIKLPFFMKRNAEVESAPTARSLFDKNLIDVVDSLIKLFVLNGHKEKVSTLLVDIIGGKYGKVKDKFKMQLHVRVAICAITSNFDYSHALYHIKKARDKLMIKKNTYSPFDIMLFYCVYGWANISNNIKEGSVGKGLISFNHVERMAIHSDKVAMNILTRVRQAMSVICKVTKGSVTEYIDRIVSLDDIAEHTSVETVYTCTNIGFGINPRELNNKLEPLFYMFVSEYGLLTHPLCGKYERGNPETITTCINEFIKVYTNEPPRYRITEQEMIALEEKYFVNFNRETLKFKFP